MENILELSLLCLREHSELIGELKSVLLILGKVDRIDLPASQFFHRTDVTHLLNSRIINVLQKLFIAFAIGHFLSAADTVKTFFLMRLDATHLIKQETTP